MKLLNPLRIACSLADRSYVWAGDLSENDKVKTFVAPSYIWAGHFRTGKIK